MTHLAGRVLAALAVLFAAAAADPAVAWSQPEGDAGTVHTATYTWQQLGMSSAVNFTAANSPQTLTIPVPNGLTPQRLQGVSHSAVNIAAGYLEAQDADGRSLGAVPIPDIATRQVSVPFSIEVATVPVRNQVAEVRLLLRQTGGDAICGPPPNLTLSDITVTFSGQVPEPTTVQQFFPPVVPAVDVFVDPDPTDAEMQTVLSIVSALTVHYHPGRVGITVRPLGRADAPPQGIGELYRAVVVRDSTEPGIAVVPNGATPYLAVTGRAGDLERQAALFSSNLLAIAQTPSATVESTAVIPVAGAHAVSFGDLNATGKTTVLGESTIYIGFDTAWFALSRPGPIDVHLLAHHTPVQEAEKATLTVSAGSQTVRAVELNESGFVDTKFAIPAGIVARNAGLALTLTYQPGPGACNPRTVPMSFEVDPASTATFERGGAVSMGGFAALPLGFAPTFQVAMDNSDPDALAHAATIVAFVQQTSPIELRPILVGLDEAAAGGSGALIIANAASVDARGLTPPLGSSGNVSTVDLPPSVSAAIPQGLATIQAYAHNDRTVVLVTTSGDWSLAGPLFAYLGGLENGWRDLTGDVLVTGAGAVPQTLTIRADGPVAPAADIADRWKPWAWVSVAAVVLAGIAVGALLLRRRKTKAARQSDG